MYRCTRFCGPLFLAVVFLVACSVPVPTHAQIARFILHSDPTDFVGMGQNVDITYTPQNTGPFGYFLAQTYPWDNVQGQPAVLLFSFMSSPAPDYSRPDDYAILMFQTNTLGVPLTPGTYLDAQRAPFAAPGHPGMFVAFQHRGSEQRTSSFIVDDFTYEPDPAHPGSVLIDTFAVRFQQEDLYPGGAFSGSLTYSRTTPSAVPEPASSVLLLCGMLSSGWWIRRSRKEGFGTRR